MRRGRAVMERPVRYSRYTAVAPGSSPLNSPCVECALIGIAVVS
jgi:hypothetical protein